MVYIARKNVNITAHANDGLPRAALYAVSLVAFIFITMTNTVIVNTLFTSATAMMRTMTSMMIIMPIKGIR